MTVASVLQSLALKLSDESRVLTDINAEAFRISMKRWSNYGLKQPAAIIQPADENDVHIAVKTAIEAQIPIIACSGGHSPFSIIGDEGIVIDLSRFTGVTVNDSQGLATVQGGTLMKELQTTLHQHQRFAPVGNGSTVGVIPFYIGGGLSTYSPYCGYGCENIVAAKLVTARGELLSVSEVQNAELFWAIRGAGQFFGLVTEITIKTHPYKLMGNAQGQRIVGTFGFTTDKLDAVWPAITALMTDKGVKSAGHLSIVMAPPDFQQQVILASPQVFATADEAAKLFAPLIAAGPILQTVLPSTFDKHSDHLDYLSAKGDFKRFSETGLLDLDIGKFRGLIKLHLDFVSAYPDAAMSGLTLEWHTPNDAPHADTAFGPPKVGYWLNVLTWHKDARIQPAAEALDKAAQALGRVGDAEDNYVTYTNTSRDNPLAWRYKGQDRIRKLKELKRIWDPNGIFTGQLLDTAG